MITVPAVRHIGRILIILIVWRIGIDLPHAQQGTEPPASSVVFLPGNPVDLRLDAADAEPRAGMRKETGTSRMVLDIGSTIDFAEFRPGGDTSESLRAGADFFTYALSTSIAGHRLQIDAVDGFFGGHLLFRTDPIGTGLSIRVRVLHRSAHFVDGHYDLGTNSWRDGREPIPFTKDFGEVLFAFGWDSPRLHGMVYSAIGYSTLIRPVNIRRMNTFHGVEVRSGDAFGNLFGKPLTVFAAYNLSLDGIPRYIGTNTISGGIKFGEWSGSGLKLLVSFRSGLDLFGEYYDIRRDALTLGFVLDLW